MHRNQITGLAVVILFSLIALHSVPTRAQSPICASLSPTHPAYALYGCGTASASQQEELVEGIGALAVERVEAQAFGQIEVDSFDSGLVSVFEVPTGKVLVVEYVSVTATVRDNPTAGVSLFARGGGHVLGILEKTGNPGGLGGVTDALGKAVRISVAPESRFLLLLGRPDRDPTNAVSFSVRISGFLEDAPL